MCVWGGWCGGNQVLISSKQSKEKIQEAERKVEQLEQNNNIMKKEIIDLKARSMCDNLVFYNIQEQGENAMEKIFSFLGNELKIESPQQNIKIDLAHRMGRKQPEKTRPIVVKLNYFQDREAIRQRAHLPKGKRYGISEQFPQEIAQQRKKLIPLYKKAKQEGKRATIKYDKLIVEGRVIKAMEKSWIHLKYM